MEETTKKLLTDIEKFLEIRGFELDTEQKGLILSCLKQSYLDGRLDGLEWSLENFKK